jgi:DNA-binding MarR family transcriptional regulator
MNTDKFTQVSQLVRKTFGMGNNVPATWVEAFIMVYASGSEGIRAQELIEQTGVSQGIISRMISLLSLSFNPETKKMEGKDIFKKELDNEYRHQVRIFLSKEGKALAAKIEAIINK